MVLVYKSESFRGKSWSYFEVCKHEDKGNSKRKKQPPTESIFKFCSLNF